MKDDGQEGSGSIGDERGVTYGSLRHELAERLQAADNYLRVARRLLEGGAFGRVSLPEAIDKAIEQLERAEATFHQLRRDG